MRQAGEPSVEEILDSIKKVIARDNRAGADDERRNREERAIVPVVADSDDASAKDEVLDLLASGAANKVIARRLGISPNTVKTHVARLFEKLEAANRTEAIHKALALDILP